MHTVANESISYLKKHKLGEARLKFPFRHCLFTCGSSQAIRLRWLLVWVHVPQIFQNTDVKLIFFSAQTGVKWLYKVVNECISHLKIYKLGEALLQFPDWHSLFTYASSQIINLRWLLDWVHVIHILQKAYVKVNQYIHGNRCWMPGCMMLLMNASAIWKKYKLLKAYLDSLFGVLYLHVLLHMLSVWDGFSFRFMCLKFCRTLMWKLIYSSAQTGVLQLHKIVNECITNLENINFVKSSFNFLFGNLYLHLLIHKLLFWDSFLFEYMRFTFWK